MKTENYTTPKLCGDDLSKDWFVFSITPNQLSGKKKLFRYKMGINRLKTKKNGECRASAIISALSIKLREGRLVSYHLRRSNTIKNKERWHKISRYGVCRNYNTQHVGQM